MAIGLISSVLIARALGPALFGLYVTLGAITNITGAVADFGLSSTAVKRISAARRDDPTAMQSRARVFVWIRLITAAGIIVPAILLAEPLSRLLLGRTDSSFLLQLALVGVFATALSGTVTTLLQAARRFRRITVVTLTNAALTALLAGILAWTGRLTIVTTLLVLGIGTSLASFVVGWRLLPVGLSLHLPLRENLVDEGRRLVRFSRWLWIANLLAMLAAQVDILLVNRWSAPAAVGAYALALNLAGKVDVVNQSLFTVLLPTASTLDGDSVREYVWSELRRSGLICLALLPLFVLIRPFVLIFYGPAYAPAIDLFRLLLGVVIFDVFTTPILLLAFPLDHPKALATADALRVVILVATATLLIPSYGPAGAAFAKFGAKLGGALVLILLLRTLVRSRSTPPHR